MAAINLQGISKRFGQVQAVCELDLTVADGARLAILGRSGAGKTTLLRILCGLERPDQGTIWLNDQDVTQVAPHARSTALVTQDYALYPQLNVQQNLEAALSSCRLTTSARQQRIAETLSWFEIADLVKRLPGQLSGGQLQRVAIAKAIVRRPDLLVLDEPLSQVDALLKNEIRDLLRAAVERFQTTLIMVTHDPLDALLLGTQLAIVDAGAIVQAGSPQSLYTQPANRLVAELLSPFGVNWFLMDKLKLAACAELRGGWLAEQTTVGFRPEHVQRLTDLSDAGECLVFKADITELYPAGFAQLAQARVADQACRIVDYSQSLTTGSVQLAVQSRNCLWLGS